ncbi:MAG: hypothetical protein WCW25_05560 [Patescibacteria group bacterium]|jgi:hypothetical protein
MEKPRVINLSAIIFLVALIFFLRGERPEIRRLTALAGAGHNIYGFAWSENIGWVSFNSRDCDADDDGLSDGSPVGCPLAGMAIPDYGVNIDAATGDLSGYAWSENIGWISFNRSDAGSPPGQPYLNGTIIAHYNGGNNQIEGWAKILGLGGEGWLKLRKFSADTGADYGVSISPINGELFGWAWNGSDANSDGIVDTGIGWLDFSGVSYGSFEPTESPVLIGGARDFAFGEQAGWIDFNVGIASTTVYSDHLEGWAFGEQAGWIQMNPAGGGVLLDQATGKLSGYAFGETVGWINFAPDVNNYVKINFITNEFEGWAFGEQAGWISFNCANTSSCGSSDYKVILVGEGPLAPAMGVITEDSDCVGGSKTITVNWTDNSSNEIGFRVEKSDDGINWPAPADPAFCYLSYDLSDARSSESGVSRSCSGIADPGAEYYFRVKALGTGGNDSAWSPDDSGQTYAVGHCPPELMLESFNCEKVDLSWTYDGEDVHHYDIYRNLTGNDPWDEAIASTTPPTAVFSDTDIISGERYYYKVNVQYGNIDSNILGPVNPCPDMPLWKEVKPR